MEMIVTPRLSTVELRSFAERAVNMCKPHQEMQQSIEKAESDLSIFQNALKKQQASAERKTNLDKTRDGLLSGFFLSAQSEQWFPHTNSAESDLSKLFTITDKYRPTIRRMARDGETAAIDTMLEELEELNFDAISENSCARWILPLKEANEAFKNESEQYISDSTQANEKDSATTVAPALIDSLNEMFAMFFAYTKVSNNSEMTTNYKKLETLVDSYR